MRYANLKIETQEVQVKFTVKMTKKELKQLVDVLGSTTVNELVSNGCSLSAANSNYEQYSMFLKVLNEVENAVQ